VIAADDDLSVDACRNAATYDRGAASVAALSALV
jgi:hypothetical protein